METIAYTVAGVTTELSFTALGVGLAPKVTFGTHGPSKFTLPLPGVAPETAAIIPFEAPCVIHTGRAGTPGAYTGGTILFQGRRTDNSGSVSGSSVSSELTIEDAWYDLRFLTLQAVWQVITGGTVGSPAYGTNTWPDCVLFQATPGLTYTPNALENHITTGQAIVEMLQYAITFGGVNLKIGQIDPSLYVPFYPIRSLRCADALKIALRVHPDCTTEIDYTTTPPTFNIRQRGNLTALTLPYNSSSTTGSVTQTHLTSQVKPRPDLQASRVGIYLKETSSIAGQTVISIGYDIWPPGAPSGLRSFDTSLDMTGPKTSLVTGQTTAYTFDPTSLDFWTTHVPTLDSATHPEVVPGSLTIPNPSVNPSPATLNCITVLDSAKNPIDYLDNYPNYLGGQGTVHPWMPVHCTEAFVTAYLTYRKQKNIGTTASPAWVPGDHPGSHPHTVKVKLTTAAAGTVPYTLSTTLSTGETYPAWYVVLPSLAPVPAGTPGATPMTLAQNVYLSLAPLQYNFNHTILEQPFTTIIKPGKHALNLSGGATAWQTMAALIQESTIEFICSPQLNESGAVESTLTISKTSVRCGPVEHLEPGQLVQLFNLFQNRDLNKINPNERAGGLPNGGANTAMPSDTAKEDSTAALPDSGYAINSAVDSTPNAVNINALTLDPANGQITLPTYAPGNATAGVATPLATGLIAPEYSGSGAPGATTLAAGINYRVGWRYFDTAGQNLYRCTVAGTVSGTPATNSSTWVQISGGAGGGGVWI